MRQGGGKSAVLPNRVDPIQKMLEGLYAITDSRLTPADSVLEMAEKALAGGARILQLRDKQSPDGELVEVARRLKNLCRRYRALFIMNDRVELAQAVGADGVHIGKDDTPYQDARRILGERAIIGVSCYNQLERAVSAWRAGADYVAFGSFFPSPTKPEAVRASKGLIGEARAVIGIPVCAIGGITAANASGLIDAGADMVAVISDLWTAPDIRARAREFSAMFDSK